jgi:FkbM family methyltransferase
MTTFAEVVQRKWMSARWKLVRSMRERLTIKTRQGVLSFSTRDNAIGRTLYCQGDFQFDLTERVVAFLRERELLPALGQGVVLDIGANIGVISIGLLAQEAFSAAIGIEPEPRNFALLRENVEQNRLVGRYLPMQFAVSDRSGECQLELSNDNYGDHRVRISASQATANDRWRESTRDVISVRSQTIDAILEMVDPNIVKKISLVWIDTQGHEPQVLAGGERLFSSGVSVVAEVWPYGIERSGSSVDDFCVIARRYWRSFWVWRRCGKFVQYPIEELPRFCEELGSAGEYDDIVFTRN